MMRHRLGDYLSGRGTFLQPYRTIRRVRRLRGHRSCLSRTGRMYVPDCPVGLRWWTSATVFVVTAHTGVLFHCVPPHHPFVVYPLTPTRLLIAKLEW